MMRSELQKQRSGWDLWLPIGATMGGALIGGLTLLLGYLTTGEESGREYIPPVAMFTAVLGAIGGGCAGCVCAAVTAVLERGERRMTAPGYALLAAVVTAGLASWFGWWLTGTGGVSSEGGAATWVVLPVVVSTVVAASGGWWIWTLTRRPAPPFYGPNLSGLPTLTVGRPLRFERLQGGAGQSGR